MPGPPGGLESGRERPFEVCWDIGGRNRGRYRVSTPRSVALFVDPRWRTFYGGMVSARRRGYPTLNLLSGRKARFCEMRRVNV